MKVHEYQAKQLMAARGIPIPSGGWRPPPGARPRPRPAHPETGNPVVVLKSQIHAGGRGKGNLRRAS